MRSIQTDRLRLPEFQGGWLLFQSDDTKKRLAPFPDDWRSFAPAEMERLCAKARIAHTFNRPQLTGEFPKFDR